MIWLTVRTSSIDIHNPEFNGLLRRRVSPLLATEVFLEFDPLEEKIEGWDMGARGLVEGLSCCVAFKLFKDLP
jgi:hypothetical protein